MTLNFTTMPTLKWIAAFAAGLLLACGSCKQSPDTPTPDPTPETETEADVKFATFNIRLDTERDTEERDWSVRKANCASVVQTYGFDIFGMQEVLENQQQDLRELLPGYQFYFVGRNDGINGEACGIAYNPDKLEAVEQGRFWLSNTPDVPSNSMEWGGMTRRRVAVWLRMKDKASRKEVIFLSTHLEVNNNGKDYAEIRKKSAELIIQRMQAECADEVPVVIVGDFNPGSDTEESLELFRAQYSDAFQVAEAGGFRQGCKATYNAFNVNANMDRDNGRSDILFYTRSMQLKEYIAITDKFDGYWPSDHVPVMARLVW